MIASYFTPEDLVESLQYTGHTVTVTDSRFFANFGHLHWNGQDVMMPFFLNTQILVPGTDHPLLVPVSHAEYEWHIRGPLLNKRSHPCIGVSALLHSQWRLWLALELRGGCYDGGKATDELLRCSNIAEGKTMASAKNASSTKYGSAAGKSVEREMKAMKAGTLESGRSHQKVTNPKQAIAIGLSEGRKAGAKMPPAPDR